MIDGRATKQSDRPPQLPQLPRGRRKLLKTIMRRYARKAHPNAASSSSIPLDNNDTSSPEQHRDWSHLPADLLHAITRRFTKLRDVTRFQAVCKPWRRAAALDQAVCKFRQTLPWLTWSCGHYDAPNRPNCQRVADVLGSKNQRPLRHIGLPFHPQLGSAFGWLLVQIIPRGADSLYLLNPLTGAQILLPSTTAAVRGFAMSAAPTSTEGCLVMIFYGGYNNNYIDGRIGLAFCKLGRDQRWRLIPEVERLNFVGDLEIVFWKERFHAMDRKGQFATFDFVGPNHDQIVIREGGVIPFRPRVFFSSLNAGFEIYWIWMILFDGYHLAVSPEGELMLVAGHGHFSVCRLVEDERLWVEVDTIGDYALFFDSYKAVFVSTTEHPECKRNCVYHMRGIFDIGGGPCENKCFASLDPRASSYFAWISPSNY